LINREITKLSTEEKWILVQNIMADLRRGHSKQVSTRKENTGLVYGKYKNFPGPETTEEDFKLAEYHFNEDAWK
jgi:hypothetical protein